MSNRQCPKCGEEYSDTYRSCPFCEEEEALRKGKPLHRQGGKRLEKRRASSSGGAGGVMLLLTGVIILGVVAYVFMGDRIAGAMGIRTETTPPASQDDNPLDLSITPVQEPSKPPESQAPSGEDLPAVDPSGGESQGGGTTPPDEPAGPLALSQSSFTIPAGEVARLTTTGGSGDVTWSSSNENIATVEDGAVTGKAGGAVTITATCGEETATCSVTITGDPWVSSAKLSLNKTDFTFGSKDADVQMKVKGTDSPVTWASANTSVATVSESGVVKWVGKGTTKITASVDGQVLECIVRAK